MRTPLCGRNFEYMSEDPYLISKIAVPFIKGIQENDVAACVKHFAVNNQETNRIECKQEVDERTLEKYIFQGLKQLLRKLNLILLWVLIISFRVHFVPKANIF